MTIPEPEVRVTRYEVSCLPEAHEDADLFTVAVEYRGGGRWAVTRRTAYYDAEGNRSWGSEWPGGKEPVTEQEMAAAEQAHEEWLTRHRFDEKTALDLAKRLAPQIEYRGYTVAAALAAHASGEALDA